MRKHNLAFIDTETTGLNIIKHEIIEIGCIIVSQDWKDGKPVFEVVDEFDIKVKPARIEDADPVALRINGYNEADWTFAYTLKEAMQLVAEKTKDAIMVSHNVAFDFAYLEKAFLDTGVTNEMHYHKLDTISFAYAKLQDQDIGKFSLRSLCEHFGIENKRAHTALADARAMFEIFKKLSSM